MLNILFHAYQRVWPNPRRLSCTTIKEMFSNRCLACTLFSSADFPLLALLDFQPKNITTHLSTSSNTIRLQIHLPTPPKYFCLLSLLALCSPFPPHAAPPNFINPPFTRLLLQNKRSSSFPFSAPFFISLCSAFSILLSSPSLSASLSILYVHSLSHPTQSKEELPLSLSAIFFRTPFELCLT